MLFLEALYQLSFLERVFSVFFPNVAKVGIEI